MITLQEFLHTPQFIMLALEKGHADYEIGSTVCSLTVLYATMTS